MKILLLTQEPPLRSDEVVSGNAVRSLQLTEAMQAAGHEVSTAWLARRRERGERRRQFRNADELQAIISRSGADVILAGYWELLHLLPYETPQPVVLDFVAPRTLEELFESPGTVRHGLRRLRDALRRCDLILVGNDLQRHLLVNSLIEAGFDLRKRQPLAVVPLGAVPAGKPLSDPREGTWTLVTGGVSWPWRVSGSWERALADAARPEHTRVIIFGGRYRWQAGEAAAPSNGEAAAGGAGESGALHRRELEPYLNFSRFLSDEAHIGVELAEWNIERAYSQSFRSLEFLRHGLPLLCNRYLPIAPLIEQYQAGWLLDEPAQLAAVLEKIRSDAAEWRRRSDNATRLVAEALSPERTARALLDWLAGPQRAARLPEAAQARDETPVLGVPPLGERLRRQWGLIRRFGLARLFRLRPQQGGVPGRQDRKGVIIVTRADLFPPDHGAAVRTLETAHALARRGMAVGLVTDDRRCWYELGPEEVCPRRYPWWLALLSLPAPLAKLLHYSKDLPYRDSFLYLPMSDGSYFWRVLAANRAVGAGVLQAEFPAYAKPCLEAAEVLRCGVVLVEHNVEYERLRAQVTELTGAQYERFRDIELDLCRRSDAVVCVSDNDRRQLEAAGVSASSLHTIPHGVNIAAVDAAAPVDARARFGIPAGAPLLVFHGAFSYPPNREALRMLAEILLPALERRGLECHVLAVGRDAPAVAPHPRIHFPGSVEHIGAWLRGADIAVVPLIEGGGTRMKILDYFAARLPLVTTSKGIEGIPVDNGEQALVSDDWPAFIEAIAELWEDRGKASALAGRGRAFAEALDWDEIAGRYLRLYGVVGR